MNSAPVPTKSDTKQSISLATETSIAHHIKGIRPALTVMAQLGFSASDCLKGSGISLQNLEESDQGISLQQEFAFYRRLLELTQDPQLGLKLGQAYRLENYGMLGYAILSAQTLGEALEIAKEFGPLSFSHFELDFLHRGDTASIIMRHNKTLENSLMTLYEDRDCAAILYGSMLALGKSFPIKKIDLMHPVPVNSDKYEVAFKSPVSFEQAQMRICFSSEILMLPMPLRDPETSSYCRKQCELLLDKISYQKSLSSQIKKILTQNVSHYPTIVDLSKTLNISERSIRRKLMEEGYKFQNLLNEARFEQAKKLLKTDLTLSDISQKLAYSEAGNFSHAFKRWSGISPKQYRDGLRKN